MTVIDRKFLMSSVRRRLNDAKYYMHRAEVWEREYSNDRENLQSLNVYLRYEWRVLSSLREIIYSLKWY